MCPARFATRHDRADADTTAERSEHVPAPLVVGAADDRAEVEADRLAGEVIARLGGGEAHQHGAGCGHGDVQRSAAPTGGGAEVGLAGGTISQDLSSRIEGERGGGSALSGSVRSRLEGGFGGSLGDVRIHTGQEAAALSRSISARAFTTGKDIFFGAGEYRPDTPEGEHMLAHEVAHTRQSAGGARRTAIRRWDIGAKNIDWDKTVKVATVSSGQMVYFLQDSSGDKLAVKKEDNPIGLGEMAAVMHQQISGVKSVKHRALKAAEVDQIISKVVSPSFQDVESWTKLGAETKANSKFAAQMEEVLGLGEGGLSALTDLEVGQKVHAEKLDPAPKKMVAMTFAEGDTAGKVAGKADPNQMKPEKNRLRALLTDFKHMEKLGQLTAVDLFLGNKDRVFYGNLGNWVYDPHSAMVTAIDHVDGATATMFKSRETVMEGLRTKELRQTAKDVVMYLAIAAGEAGDTEFKAWIDSDGGYRRALMEEALENGLIAGRKLLVKTFTATRFTIGGSKARAVKKSIKKAGREAMEIDDPAGDKDSYYKLLKARAEWLKKS